MSENCPTPAIRPILRPSAGQNAEPGGTGLNPSWLSVAVAEIGVAQYPVGRSNSRISEYHDGTTMRGRDDKVPWCSSFVNWCLTQVGIAGTGSALARSWLEWGRALGEPVPGCIVVLHRGDPTSWKGHVGFYLRSDTHHIYLLGGNQLEEVREYFYPIDSVLGYRWPATAGPNRTVEGE